MLVAASALLPRLAELPPSWLTACRPVFQLHHFACTSMHSSGSSGRAATASGRLARALARLFFMLECAAEHHGLSPDLWTVDDAVTPTLASSPEPAYATHDTSPAGSSEPEDSFDLDLDQTLYELVDEQW